ncbi:uncharacterized protein LOC117588286 isoform X2 [Drosophila guanche]|uniref:SprT-like domain-containing protein n=3 Tax=Drosophila guanche TaxID=7266 RepID=A0A3B0JXW1_DROGU|nr:uncharacterized protein LOC117588286 isoform X2 [Drosophila guanche]SPP86907.1 Hypothetical predicted protein [Drosophila guanche]
MSFGNNISLENMLENLEINDDDHEDNETSPEAEYSPCKLPQMLEACISDDENTLDIGDSSSVVFVDSFILESSSSLSSSPQASCIDSSEVVDSFDNNSPVGSFIDETEPEEDNDNSSDSSLDEMNLTPPRKRKSPVKTPSINCKSDQSDNRASTPTSPKATTVTRSGRAVRAVLDTTFDYSSSQPEGEEDESYSLWDNTDDEDYSLDVGSPEPKWSSRKPRRVSYQHSHSSSSESSSPASPKRDQRLIYIDLSQPVAIVGDAPLPELSVDDDADLKTRLLKFLGLMAPRRRLYNPMDNYEDNPNCSPSKKSLQDSERSPPTKTIIQVALETPNRLFPPTTPMRKLNISLVNAPNSTIEERQAKFCDDLVFQANATYIEHQAPAFLKEPIDLSCLPSEKQRESICRRHNGSIACLEEQPHFYGFIESLNPRTSINLCHPQALIYRQSDFEKCKVALAKVLFGVFNHAIFHCGLQEKIEWKSNMNTPCSSELGFSTNGKRIARILLWEQINQTGMLIKPLLHEMCHVAAFVFNCETGHGDNCRKWTYQAKSLIPELALISDCEASHKYTCTLCARCSYGRLAFVHEVELLRCHYCQFEVHVERWSATDTQKMTRINQLSTPFKTYVREHYLEIKQVEAHSAKMQELNQQFMDKETS